MKTIKAVAVGDSNVGKTAMMCTYVKNDFPFDHIPTVFDNYSAITEFDQKHIILSLWDTAGSEEYVRLRSLSYPDTQVFLLCFDVECRESFENIVKWEKEVRHYAPDAKILLIATKIDMRSDVTISPKEGRAMAEKINADGYIECSAIMKEGISEVFETALRLVLRDPAKEHKKYKHRNSAKCSLL